MQDAPKSVIHINFVPIDLSFDARPIWAAMRSAENKGKLAGGTFERISAELGGTAIHIATRDYVMRAAVRELKSAIGALSHLVPFTLSLDEMRQPRFLNGDKASALRDRAILAVDSFLFEFRAFLELLAPFCYQVLLGIGREPGNPSLLTNGKPIVLKQRNNKLKTHAFLQYLCDALKMSSDWYEFLAVQRNFFTHGGTPYCAIEDRLMMPPEYDLLVMRENITDFSKAAPDQYFRLSDCGKVLTGVRQFASGVQGYLIQQIQLCS